MSHPEMRALRNLSHISDVGFLDVRHMELLATNPVNWVGGYNGPLSANDQFRGALWPLPANMHPKDHEVGFLTSGVALRFGSLSSTTQEILGLEIKHLTDVECGAVRAKIGKTGALRVSELKPESLFSLTERDWLLYHDLDCALFHNNLQENVARRCEAWRSSQSRL